MIQYYDKYDNVIVEYEEDQNFIAEIIEINFEDKTYKVLFHYDNCTEIYSWNDNKIKGWAKENIDLKLCFSNKDISKYIWQELYIIAMLNLFKSSASLFKNANLNFKVYKYVEGTYNQPSKTKRVDLKGKHLNVEQDFVRFEITPINNKVKKVFEKIYIRPKPSSKDIQYLQVSEGKGKAKYRLYDEHETFTYINSLINLMNLNSKRKNPNY